MGSGIVVPPNKRAEVAAYILTHPQTSYIAIGREFGLCEWTVVQIAKQFNIKRPAGRKKRAVAVSKKYLITTEDLRKAGLSEEEIADLPNSNAEGSDAR